ncbi:unnamed protein product [Bursaphelenchus okinawaensis]|uniref:Glycosyltransferase family 92 protein n=1 Tax=Bursaphelenchus okinawaensis TaxID=465554 RepID=A0A811L879_9BILA|nr:unnamed protein product [Bursaphelenchus okinawaensis]CAG9120940.1 unnamed protein product [Bursaphelenchus okinawaensis]
MFLKLILFLSLLLLVCSKSQYHSHHHTTASHHEAQHHQQSHGHEQQHQQGQSHHQPDQEHHQHEGQHQQGHEHHNPETHGTQHHTENQKGSHKHGHVPQSSHNHEHQQGHIEGHEHQQGHAQAHEHSQSSAHQQSHGQAHEHYQAQSQDHEQHKSPNHNSADHHNSHHSSKDHHKPHPQHASIHKSFVDKKGFGSSKNNHDNRHHEGHEDLHLDKDGNFIDPHTQQVLKELNELHFVKPMETENVPCDHLLQPQIDKHPFGKKYRLTYKDPDFEEDLATDCESIWLRNNFYTKPLSREEEDFPLAYARNVYKDYRFIEMELSTTYAPQNLYCFGIDGKSDALFQLRMRNLSQCFNNVFLTEYRYTMDSKGHNTNLYHIECMKVLRETQKPYKYLFLLQNHDVALHTNEEMVHILTTFHGTNDVTTVPTRPTPKIKWDFESMRVFKNIARNRQVQNNFEPKLVPTRGFVQSTLSKAAVDFILEELFLDVTIAYFSLYPKSKDEYLFSTINNNDNIALPGGFTSKCTKNNGTTTGITRYNIWQRNATLCESKLFRHGLCVFGLEDLVPKLADSPFFFANKMMPEKDFSAISCWHEMLFNRTYHQRGLHYVKENYYWKLPTIRFRSDSEMMGDKFDSDTFNCTAYEHEKIGTNIQPDGLRLVES